MKNFALIVAAGYVAPRHMRAIKETGNQLVAAFDPYDGVGVMDSFFPKADFFVEFERFDRHIDKNKRNGKILDYVSICSPNYLHDSHIRFSLRQGANAICEKPLVLNPWNVSALAEIEEETGKKVYNILQLRLHPSIIALKKMVESDTTNKIFDIDLTYITSRGHWYYASWKGDGAKSGGIATNIGIHFFDMLIWIFGPVEKNNVNNHTHDRAAGYLELKNARVRWFLSINAQMLPGEAIRSGKSTFRSLTIAGKSIEFSDGFADLHTRSYKSILKGSGFQLVDAMPAIEVVHRIRTNPVIGLKGEYHPLAKKQLSRHPFNN